MSKKKNTEKKEKKGLFGRLFGKGDKDAEGGPASPGGGDDDGGAMTIAPGYNPGPGGGGAEMTIAPGYVGGPGAPGQPPADWHKQATESQDGHVNFAAKPAGGFALEESDAGLTMAPGYSPGPPGGGGRPGGTPDPFGDLDMKTMAPGYSGGAKPDPFGDSAELGERTMAPGYNQGPGGKPDPFGDLDMKTMAPGYSGGGAGPKGDPFGDLDMKTMAPGYSGGAKPDPFGDSAELGERTMAPGYNQGPGGTPDPFGDLDMKTMAPGYAPDAGGLADPFAGVDLEPRDKTPAPGYPGGRGRAPADPFGSGPARDPFSSGSLPRPTPGGGGGDLTISPNYAPGGKAARKADPFDFEATADPASDPGGRTMAPDYGVPAIKGLGGPGGARGASLDEAAFDFDAPEPVLGPGAGRPAGSGFGPVGAPADPFAAHDAGHDLGPGLELPDPFGPALLDDPFAQAGPAQVAPALAQGPGPAPQVPRPPTNRSAPLQAVAADEDDDFRGERTMVELTADAVRDVEALANLRSTDDELAIPAEMPARAGMTAGPPPHPSGAHTAARPRAEPPARARPLFAAHRPAPAGGTLCVDAAPEVVLDAARGVVYAPPVAGGWSDLPDGLALLGDGAVVGRGQVTGRSVRIPAAPPAPVDGARRLPAFPAEVLLDRTTRVARVPRAVEDGLGWRLDDLAPDVTLVRGEADVVLLFPVGTAFEADAVVVPTKARPGAAQSAAPAPRHPQHGAVVARHELLGLVETVHEDGWARLELPAGAEVQATRLLLPAPARRGTLPPLLRVERLADGRVALALPTAVRRDGAALWVGPSAPLPASAACEEMADAPGAVLDVREYLGVKDELLDSGWTRLELPEGARLERGPTGTTLAIPPEYEGLGDRSALYEFERGDDGWLRAPLPATAEGLGRRVLIPAAGAGPPPTGQTSRLPAKSAARVEQRSEPKSEKIEAKRPEPTPPAGVPLPDEPKRKTKGLDLFRKDKPRAEDEAASAVTAETLLAGAAMAPAPEEKAPLATVHEKAEPTARRSMEESSDHLAITTFAKNDLLGEPESLDEKTDEKSDDEAEETVLEPPPGDAEPAPGAGDEPEGKSKKNKRKKGRKGGE